MSAESAESFLDNWAYLKTELHWLERLLMMAVARQRKDVKDVERVSRTSADRATSHWWKGVISLEGSIAYDEFRKAPPVSATMPYQQQLETRVKLAQERGVVLALPLLRDRLGLSLFEKNLVLMGIAPEVNHRYARLYNYLQGDEHSRHTDLPTLDLVLRLMCRNDEEWRRARSHLVNDSPLRRYNLVQFVAETDNTFLNHSVKLADSLVDYLLAEQPTPEGLTSVLDHRLPPTHPSHLRVQPANTPWEALVLPHRQQQVLQRLVDLTRPGLGTSGSAAGHLALIAGASGTGKTLAAQAIATALATPLVSVDLATIDAAAYPHLLQELATTAPTVVMIRAAEHWLKRSAEISATALQHWLTTRRHQPGLTLFSVTRLEAVSLSWLRHMLAPIVLPHPQASDRLQLWQRAIPSDVTVDPMLDWASLAEQLALTGGEIQAIAQTALTLMTADQTRKLSLERVLHALEHHGHTLKVVPRRAKAPKRRSPTAKKSPKSGKSKPEKA